MDSNNNSFRKPTSSSMKRETYEFDVASDQLLVEEKKGYKSAGILPIRVNRTGNLEVLLPFEFKNGQSVLNILGGMRENSDKSPMETALREFTEETAHLVKGYEIKKFLENPETCGGLWLGFGKYVLYIILVPYDMLDSIPKKYRENYNYRYHMNAEASKILWIKWNSLKEFQKQDTDFLSENQEFPLGEFLKKVLKEPKVDYVLSRLIYFSLFHHLLENSELKPNQMKSEILTTNWKLPFEPLPPPPIEKISKTDPKCQNLIQKLPNEIQTKILSVRQVNVSSKTANYQKEKKKIGAAANILYPIFHGTPETWRATAIAIHGFDLRIRLCGRALGDGVYSSTDPSVAFGYGRNGSILCLEGLVTKPDTTISGNVFVFKDPRHILPHYILDFAALDDKSSIEHSSLKQKQILEEMEVRQKEFEKSVQDREKKSLLFYKQKISELLAKLEHLSSKEDFAEIEKLQQNFWRERAQVLSGLPIYSQKREIIEAIQKSNVVILTAETGTGKSTQIPQYILDDVQSSESRRIAVLQPRRVNATSLASRVSHERGQIVGQEVGYSLGRGSSQKSEKTRIEFMTHGLFVQIAQDTLKLLKNYCVVLLDEAHERSVEIDLSFALLRSALEKASQSNIFFKVIILSATIGPQVDLFLNFLSPNSNKDSILSLKGTSFPVYIEHRDDISPDPKEIGTNGVGKVLSNYAMQAALDIITQTSSGNILVFVPGESHIKSALIQSSKMLEEFYNLTSLKHVEDGFKFEFILKGSKTFSKAKTQKIGVYPFHGKLTNKQKDRIISPREDRIVVFTTNIAETGLTVPDVRYVIDTGLERRVQWNNITFMNEMVTTKITASSMIQRTGRAGRVASGICIRLFSKETSETLEKVPQSKIQTGELLSGVLRLCNMKRDIPLLEKIPKEAMDSAVKVLKDLSALDENQKVTKEGVAFLSLGLDLRLGRFLLACDVVGCVNDGCSLAALLATDSHSKLISNKEKDDLESFLHKNGDHLTLLNIFKAFKKAKDKFSWCDNHNFDYDVLLEAEETYQYILLSLNSLGISLENDKRKIVHHGDIDQALLRALCSGYFDNIAIVRRPGSPKDGFSWLMDEDRQTNVLKSINNFQQQHMPPSDSQTPNNNQSLNQQENKRNQHLKLPSNSVLWTLSESETKNFPLVVFDKVMLTDGVNGKPTIHIASYINIDDVEKGAPNWCKQVNFDQLMKDCRRSVIKYPLNNEQKRLLKRNKGYFIKEIKKKVGKRNFGDIVISVEGDELSVAVPASTAPLVDSIVTRFIDQIEPGKISFSVDQNLVGKIIGKGGSSKNKILEEMNDTVYELTGDSTEEVDIRINKDGIVTLIVGGKAKSFLPLLAGRLHTIISNRYDVYPKVVVNNNPIMDSISDQRLRLLSTKQPPSGNSTRDDAILFLAHSAVWDAQCSVYGGFVRDWVMRGESANDVDVQVPSNIGIEQAKKKIIQAAQQRTIKLTKEKSKGPAHTLIFHGFWSGNPIEVDLVDPKNVQVIPPGVDCDAGNLLIAYPGILKKKVETAGGKFLSIHHCKKHIMNKKFVCFMDISSYPEVAKRRLEKYFSRGWTCLSKIPPIFPELNVYKHLMRPKEKYSKDWWNLN